MHLELDQLIALIAGIAAVSFLTGYYIGGGNE